MNIGWVGDTKYHFYLGLTNTVPFQPKPRYMQLKQEVYLDKLVAKVVIGLILLG